VSVARSAFIPVARARDRSVSQTTMWLAWAVVVVIIAVRGIVAFTLPLTGDEAYYWEWSRHLAWGYVDHPPAVAATIALFSVFGQTPGLVRLGFVLCGAVASVALAGCATELTATGVPARSQRSRWRLRRWLRLLAVRPPPTGLI
jgi:hypothetical protein